VAERLQLKVLGTFEVSWQNKPIAYFRIDKIRALLVYLCLESNRPHRRETLATFFWSDKDSKAGRHNLRQSLYRIKQTLNQCRQGLGDKFLHVTRQEVRSSPQMIRVDALSFMESLQSKDNFWKDTFIQNDSDLKYLEKCAENYKGDFLENFDLSGEPLFSEWVQNWRLTLHKQACLLFEKLAQSFQEKRNLQKANQWLTRWLIAEPWNERAHRQKMRVLAQSGQRSAALAQYHDLVTILLEEFQADPTDETEDLYQQIHCEEVQVEIKSSSQNSLHHLPYQDTPFVGREKILELLYNDLCKQNTRLLTLLGMGGAGKTRVLVELANRIARSNHPFSHGIYFIPLASLSSPQQVPSTLAQQLNLPIQAINHEKKQLIDFLKERKVLLLWDNFEHVSMAKEFLQDILHSAPHVQMIVSSRSALNMKAEHRRPLNGLLPHNAQKLFVQCANRVQPDFGDTSEHPLIEQICTKVEGFPLAIELAASWVRVMDCHSILEELQDSQCLHNEWTAFPERQKSIFTIFEHTCSMLNQAEYQALVWMSLFEGGFTPQAARHVGMLSIQTLEKLVDKALLHRNAKNRYKIHSLLKQFISPKRQELEGEATVKQRYFVFFLKLLAQQESHFLGKAVAKAMQTVQDELANIRIAWHLAIESSAFELLLSSSESLFCFGKYSGRLKELQLLFAAAINALSKDRNQAQYSYRLSFQLHQLECIFGLEEFEQASQIVQNLYIDNPTLDQHPNILARLQSVEAQLEVKSGNYAKAIQLLHHALELYQTDNERVGCSKVWGYLGRIHWQQGKYERAIELLQKGLAHDKQFGFASGIPSKLHWLSLSYKNLEHFQLAKQHLQEAKDLAQTLGFRVEENNYLNSLGILLSTMGSFNEAIICFEEAHQVYSDLGLTSSQLSSLSNIGVIQTKRGNYREAERAFLQIMHIRESNQELYKLGISQGNLGVIYTLLGEEKKAQKYLELALQLQKELGHQESAARWLGYLGKLFAQQDHFQKAKEYFIKALEIFHEKKQELQSCWLHIELGELYLRKGRLKEAGINVEKGLEYAQEIQRRDYLVRSVTLKADLLAKQDQQTTALQLLEELSQQDALPLPERARIHESLWLIRGETTDFQAAYESLQALCEQQPSVENKRRWAQLQKAKQSKYTK